MFLESSTGRVGRDANRVDEPDTPPPARVRVLRVLGSLDTGGIEQRCLELLPRLHAAGVLVSFITLSGRAGELAPDAQRLGATVHPIRIDARLPFRFVRLIRQVRPRAVHSDVATFSGALLLLAWLARVPVRLANFTSDHDGHPDTLRRRIQRSAMRRLISIFATHVTGVAPGTLTHGYRPDWTSDSRCQVLPTGIDLQRLRQPGTVDLRREIGATADDLLLLTVGRPVASKRRELVAPIVAQLARAGIASRAVLVGPRAEEDDQRVRRAARQHGVADRVHILGHQEDLGSLLRQADLLLQPSVREGLPGTVLEALAVGTPVLACDIPGVRFIREQLDGVWAVDLDAAPAQWAQAIQNMRLLGRQRRDDGEHAMRAFQQSVFSLETVAAQHLAIYTGT